MGDVVVYVGMLFVIVVYWWCILFQFWILLCCVCVQCGYVFVVVEFFEQIGYFYLCDWIVFMCCVLV